MERLSSHQRRFLAAMLAPALLLYTVFVAWPGVRALVYSFQKWDGLGEPAWAGLANFRALFADDLFLSAFRNNVILAFAGGGITIVFALFFAYLLHRRVRGAGLFRVAFFFPNVLAAVAVALLWMLLYSTTSFGVFNALLIGTNDLLKTVSNALENGLDDSLKVVLAVMLIGNGVLLALILALLSFLYRRVPSANRALVFSGVVIAAVAVSLVWLLVYGNAYVDAAADYRASFIGWFEGRVPFPFTDSRYLIYALIPVLVWTATGFYMVLFLAAMQGIPETYYEAARLDGASGWAQFRHVTLPMIWEVVVIGLVFLVISTMKYFDAVWVLESQYPTKDSHVLATVLYQKVFTEYNVGYAAAVAVMLFLIVFAATLLLLRLQRREALEF